MRAPLLFPTLLALAALGCCATKPDAHLFILSGQSNMVRLDPAESFTPLVEAELGSERTLVVHEAEGGQSIRKWFRVPEADGVESVPSEERTWDRLLAEVHAATRGRSLETVTFVWMQGERDALDGTGDEYAAGLRRLLDQLRRDLGRDDIYCVIGRLSDYDLACERRPDWVRVREAQVVVAESEPNALWVDTDDLNEGVDAEGKVLSNDLHYSVEGYRVLGERFGRAAVALIRE